MLKPREDSQSRPAGCLPPLGPHASAPAEPPASCTMPRSFLVKKIKGDGFQCSGVPAPTYHPLETAYVLPGARGPPGDNGEWDPAGGKEGRGFGPSRTRVLRRGARGREPQEEIPWRCAPSGLPESGRAGQGLGLYKGKVPGSAVPKPRTNPDFESCGPGTGLE